MSIWDFTWLWGKPAASIDPASDTLRAATLPGASGKNGAAARVTARFDPNPAPPLPHVVIPPVPAGPTLSPADEASKKARGYRNRNPGNIDFLPPGRAWNGQIGIEQPPGGAGRARFGVYDSHENGIRALVMQLKKYQTDYKLRTIAGMIDRWAPPSDGNVTSSYVAFVAKMVGVRPDEPVDATRYAVMRPMAEAVIRKELGGCPYDGATIDEGLRRAGVVR